MTARPIRPPSALFADEREGDSQQEEQGEEKKEGTHTACVILEKDGRRRWDLMARIRLSILESFSQFVLKGCKRWTSRQVRPSCCWVDVTASSLWW